MKYAMYALITWMAIGWLVVGLLTLRNPRYFRRMNIGLYVAGGMITALLWPNCVSMVFRNRSRAQ